MKMLWNLLLSALGIYLLLCLYLYVMQNRLIFFTTKADAASYQRWHSREYIVSSHGRSLQGWYYENIHVDSNTALIYFGGNAEDVIYNLEDAGRYQISKLFFTNYAGYGNSTGSPSEQTLYQDALQVYDQLMQQHQLDAASTFIMGRSLGAAVASHVASRRQVAGLILITPFTSLAELAARFYKLFPARWLLKYEFNTLGHLEQSHAPLLLIAAEQDDIMPAEHITRLQAASPHAATSVMIPDSGHNTLHLSPAYFVAINHFVQQALATSPDH